tara:strand:- start:76 stop:777 length:702 start_codon:yes stop_codon:yes gene_type:complete
MNTTPKYNYLNTETWNDRWIVEHVFNEKPNGFFVEVGANDGMAYSPTYVLEKFLNWTGILIEPNPAFFEGEKYTPLNKVRFQSKCYNVGISNKNEESIFISIEGHKNGYSGFPKLNKWGEDQWRQRISSVLETHDTHEINIPCKRLDTVLKEADAPKVIDYLSLDIEGSEEAALIDFPFDEFKFKAISLESCTFDLTSLLKDNGYFPVINPFCESKHEEFFIHSDFLEINYKI